MPSSKSDLADAFTRGRTAQAKRGTAPTREEEPTSQPVEQTAPPEKPARKRSDRRDAEPKPGARKPARRDAEPKTATRRDAEQSPKLSKRMDPDFRAATLYLKIGTSDALDDAITAANRAGKPIGDRSDVAELAIEEWLARQK